MKIRGWVYVIVNESMPGIIKVGHTTKDPWLRATGLAGTGSPTPFGVAYDALVFEPREVEALAHKQLSGVRHGKEWFKCSIWDGVSAIRACAGENLIVEYAKDPRHLKPPQQTITCEGCRQLLRVPSGMRIRITCPTCGDVFEHGP